MHISEQLSHDEMLNIIRDVEGIFVQHNKNRWLMDIFIDPQRLIKIMMRYKLYNPKQLLILFRSRDKG
jgi:hypothetical protein